MKQKRYFIINLLIIIASFYCTGFVYCFLFFRSYNPEFVRDIAHFYAAIFLVFAFTLICISKKTIPIKTSDISWGIVGVLALTIIWEIVIQGSGRYRDGQGFYVQWDQIIADVLGIAVASIDWLIKRRRFLF